MSHAERDRRAEVLDACARVAERIEAIETDHPTSPELGRLRHEAVRLRERYVELLVDQPLVRSPLSGDVIMSSLDRVDLDGLWWDYERPARPFASPEGGLLAFDGALALGGTVAPAAFLASPGAETPSVVPDVLEAHDASAVICEVPVGPHRGFVVAYFGTGAHPDHALLDDWGSKEHWRTGPHGDWMRAHRPEHEITRDHDLASWIERGRLSWIMPGDVELTLRSDTAGCPFLDLPGRRSRSYIQYGRVWWDDAPAG